MKTTMIQLMLALLCWSTQPSFSQTSVPSGSPSTLAPSSSFVDCNEFQQSVTLGDEGLLTMDYVIFNGNDDEGFLRARMIYRGQAWVALGIAPIGSVFMVPADAIIGIPGLDGAPNPAIYRLGGYDLSAVNQIATQTLMNATIEQNSTMTILTFTKRLIDTDQQPLNGDGENNLLWAYGFGNQLGIHRQRGAFALRFQTCTPTADFSGGGFIELDTGSTNQGLWSAHGVLAAIAWGIVSPLAIGASMARGFLPAGKIWLQIHFYLNASVLLMTFVAFIISIVAVERGTPSGETASHFSGVAHTSVGLIIIIFASIQVTGGIFRAPAPKKNDDGTLEEKKPIRVVWEFGHRGIGLALLAACWWQVQDGLKIYSNRFSTTDFTPIFWGVAAGLSGVIVVLYIYDKYLKPAPPDAAAAPADKDKKMDDKDDPAEMDDKDDPAEMDDKDDPAEIDDKGMVG